MRRMLIASTAAIALIGAMTSVAGAQSTPAATAAPTMAATAPAAAAAATAAPAPVTLAGYQVSVFASSTAEYFAPDSLEVDGSNIFIDYQNKTAKDCTDTKTSTVVEYTMDGKAVKTYAVPGHSDGMRVDPATHLLWVTSCEDGNPKFITIDPKTDTITPYTFAATPHGGGYDDLYFVNGKTYIAASNPTLDKNGNNPNPAVDQITLSNGKAVLTPVLMGNAKAINNTTSPASTVTLTLTDPDSLTTDGKGDLVLVSQADSELITIANPGAANQTVTVLPVGTQLDDTIWASSTNGALLVADATSGNTYWVKSSSFVVGGIYTETPDDSGVAGTLATVDPATGILTPFGVGFGKPTGMIFVPAA